MQFEDNMRIHILQSICLRLVLTCVVLSCCTQAARCQGPSKVHAVQLDSLLAERKINGRLGHPLGTLLTVRGVWLEQKEFDFCVASINGTNVERQLRFFNAWVRNVDPSVKNEQKDGEVWEMECYEEGFFAGFPREIIAEARQLPEFSGNLPQYSGNSKDYMSEPGRGGPPSFGFFTRLRYLSKRSIVSPVVASCFDSTNVVAAHLDKGELDWVGLGSATPVTGALGLQLGTFADVNGSVISTAKNDGSWAFRIESVNGKTLQKPVLIPSIAMMEGYLNYRRMGYSTTKVKEIFDFRIGDEWTIRGYESAVAVGSPEGVLERRKATMKGEPQLYSFQSTLCWIKGVRIQRAVQK